MKNFGLIGFPLKNSFSINYFTEKFEQLNLENYTYKNFSIEHIDDFPLFLKKNKDLYGLNVTIPHKIVVMKYLDELDESAKVVGAVNCIKIIRDSEEDVHKLIGYNTDIFGFEASLKPLLHLSIKKALILGNGGATKAVAYVLNKIGIEFLVVSRSPNTHNVSYQSIDENILNQYQLIINCTPVGMFPNIDDMPKIPYQFITPNHIAFDLIYLPEETLFLKKCKEQGATVKNGLDMLHLQAQKALNIFLQ